MAVSYSKYLFCTLMAAMGCTYTSGKSDSCKIVSLDKKPVVVMVEGDWSNRRYCVTNDDYNVSVYEYTGVGKSLSCKALNENFLQITAPVGTGNQGRYHVVIVGFENRKPFVALNVEGDYDFYYVDRNIEYEVGFKVYQRPHLSCNLAVTTDYLEHLDGQKNDSRRHQEIKLNFDKSNNIFYKNFQLLKGLYVIVDRTSGKEVKREFNHRYPYVHLGQNEYYFIEGTWFSKKKDNSKRSGQPENVLYRNYCIKKRR